MSMKLASVAVVLLALVADCIAAQGKFDCRTAYKNALIALRHKQVPPERMVELSRRALRIYDACETGDLEDAASFFDNLDRWKN